MTDIINNTIISKLNISKNSYKKIEPIYEITCRNLEIENDTEIEDLIYRQTIFDNLKLNNILKLKTINFCNLEIVKGDIELIDIPLLENLILDKLISLNELTLIELNKIEKLKLNNLKQIEEGIYISDNEKLKEIELNELIKCSRIQIQNCNKLKSIKINKLENVKTIVINNCINLQEISLNQLNEIETLEIDNCNENIKINLKNLKQIKENLDIDKLSYLNFIKIKNTRSDKILFCNLE